MREQGPHSPGLLDHLDRQGSGYDAAVLFVPYLYATTWEGCRSWPTAPLMIQPLHDEPPAAFPIMDRTFRLARGLAFSTPEERDFCRARFGPLRAEARLVGMGVDVPPHSRRYPGNRHHLHQPAGHRRQQALFPRLLP